jgi:hypothetical protein
MVDIIVLVFLFSASVFTLALEHVFAEGAGGSFPPVRLFPSIRLHRSLLGLNRGFLTILFKKINESILLGDELGGDII